MEEVKGRDLPGMVQILRSQIPRRAGLCGSGWLVEDAGAFVYIRCWVDDSLTVDLIPLDV